MKRTQLYLDEDVWKILEVKSAETGRAISDLVRQAVRERYASSTDTKLQAFRAVAGIWADRADLPDTQTYVRGLRKSVRRRRS